MKTHLPMTDVKDCMRPPSELARKALQQPEETHLYSVGDSFTMGVGLPDYSLSYPHILAAKRGYSVTNDGYAGSSHDRLIRRAMQFVSNWTIHNSDQKKLVVVVGCGLTRRMEFYYENDIEAPENERNYVRYTNMAKKSIQRYRNQESLEFVSLYHDHFSNKNASTTRCLTRILGLQSFLQAMGVPFMFFNSTWVPYNPNANAMSAFIDRTRYHGFIDPNKTFNMSTYEAGFTGRYESGHPDPPAHAEWARYLSEYVNDGNLWD